jgi:hypothetical protein
VCGEVRIGRVTDGDESPGAAAGVQPFCVSLSIRFSRATTLGIAAGVPMLATALAACQPRRR